MNNKEIFLEKMKKLLGNEFDDFFSSMSNILSKGLRVNTAKISVKDFLYFFKYKLKAVDWCKEGFYIEDDDVKLGKTPSFFAGLFYLQEPSAMIPGEVLDVKKGEKILDIAAAPGGKSTQIASKLGKDGLLVANDISPKRSIALAKNLTFAGAENSIVINKKPEHMVETFENYFDKILIDAPCSGEGLFKKDNKHFEDDNKKYADMQKKILESIPKMLKSNGEMVYSTCTFSPEENEKIISWFLEKNRDFQIIDIDLKGLDDGRPEWSDGNDYLSKTKRAWPHKLEGEGHFVAKLKRNADIAPAKSKKYVSNLDSSAKEMLADFIGKIGIKIEDEMNFYSRVYRDADSLYLIPKALDFTLPKKYMKLGTLLGEIKNNKFSPDTEWALILNGENCKNYVSFEEDDIRITKYLKGETINADAEDGYCLITVRGFGVGFALAKSNMLKNKYKKQWRML